MLKIAEKCTPGLDKKNGDCKGKTFKKPTGVVPVISVQESVTGGGEMLLCTECHQVITSTGEKTEVNGAYNHSFANPHGLFYEIACYKNAPGCMYSSDESAEFTWFVGYNWRVAACSGCHTHIGWLFTSSVNRFHGLISDRLIIARRDDTQKDF